MKKKKSGLKIMSILLIIVVIVMAASLYFLYTARQNQKMLSDKIASLELEISNNKQYVYVAMDDLEKGTVLEENVNVELQENVTALPADLYLQEEDLGKTLVVDVSAYEPVMANMVTEEKITKDTREYEIGVANLMVDQQVGDYVDIRIMFPNGEDYIVIPKVKVKNLILENAMFYANLNESQILTLASATIDAYTISGTKIYTTRYVEENLQEEAIPNYPVRKDLVSLMATDPNILDVAQQTLNYTAREIMEAKLQSLSEEHFKSVVEGHGIVDTANASAMGQRISEEEAAAQQEMYVNGTDGEVQNE